MPAVIDADALLGTLADRGVTEVTGVPCSFLTPLINSAATGSRVRYLGATQEGEAVAIAAGVWLAGGLGCVLSQNSGLGNMVNPLTSLLHPARIPALLLLTWRGEPGRPDEPQHRLMGQLTRPMLDLLRVGSAVLEPDPAALSGTVDAAWRWMRTRALPYAVVIRDGTIAGDAVPRDPRRHRRECHVARHGSAIPPPTRIRALECLLASLPDRALVVATTGKTSRELFELCDADNHFYVTGAMGSASAVGLGVALRTTRPVVVVDGDGALLMRMGTLATTGAHGPRNLIHLVLDNGVHDSTGGQPTVSTDVDLTAAAAACGYRRAHRCGDLADLSAALLDASTNDGPTFVHLRIGTGSRPGLGRPTIGPDEVARRFRTHVATDRSRRLVE